MVLTVWVAGSVGMVVLSPTAWSHYLVLWLVPIAVLVATLVPARTSIEVVPSQQRSHDHHT